MGECLQALDNTESTKSKVFSENGEESIKECSGPAEFGKNENNRLSYDQQAVENGPECPGWLIGHCASSDKGVKISERRIRFQHALDVIALKHIRNGRVYRAAVVGDLACHNESIDCLDVMYHYDDTAGEDQEQGDDAEKTNSIESDERIYIKGKPLMKFGEEGGAYKHGEEAFRE
jgi:hypothetical protein